LEEKQYKMYCTAFIETHRNVICPSTLKSLWTVVSYSIMYKQQLVSSQGIHLELFQ